MKPPEEKPIRKPSRKWADQWMDGWAILRAFVCGNQNLPREMSTEYLRV